MFQMDNFLVVVQVLRDLFMELLKDVNIAPVVDDLVLLVAIELSGSAHELGVEVIDEVTTNVGHVLPQWGLVVLVVAELHGREKRMRQFFLAYKW